MNLVNPNEKSPFALIILDGWGVAPVWAGNAISIAQPRNFNKIIRSYPSTTLLASDGAVGLPSGAPGNSEAGHLNIGAGSVVYQDQPMIDKQIADGSFFQNPTLLAAIDHAKKNNSKLHLIGLMSKTGTHSQIDHAYALLKMCKQANFTNVYLHLFTDGRDSDSMSGIETLSEIDGQTKVIGVGQISTLIGRFYAMDRDNRWDRVKSAYDLLTLGKGNQYSSTGEIFTKSYARGITDEFIGPSLIVNKSQNPGLVSDNDAVIYFNFRADRAKELTQAFLDPNIGSFLPGTKRLQNIYFASFVMHGDAVLGHHVFSSEQIDHPLAQIVSENNMRQYHSAETEKYAHVTYFINGGRENQFPGEDWRMISSPKSVATYDLLPEMSAQKVTDDFVSAIRSKKYDCFMVNYANTDMVGHTGNLKAAVRAVEFVDECLGKVMSELFARNGTAFVFADHGNVEQMINPATGEPDTEHTTNPVPFIVANNKLTRESFRLRPDGALANISPTVCELMSIKYDVTKKTNSLIVE